MSSLESGAAIDACASNNKTKNPPNTYSTPNQLCFVISALPADCICLQSPSRLTFKHRIILPGMHKKVLIDLTWLSWTKLCEKVSLERSLSCRGRGSVRSRL